MKDEIKEPFSQIDLSWCPPQIGNFVFKEDKKDDGDNYLLFHYTNAKGWRWQAFYDAEVEDYTVHIYMPLFSFADISFVNENLADYEAGLRARLEMQIQKVLVNPADNFTYPYKVKGLPEWDYQESLPEQIGGYTRDIAPDKAIRMINGSYIIAEYVKDDDDKSGLLLFYNVLRDEFFAELRAHNYPEINHEVDAKSLTAFEKVLKEKLPLILDELTKRL